KKESSRQHSASSTSPTKRGPPLPTPNRPFHARLRQVKPHDASALPSSSLKSTGDAGDTPELGS
ncbi:Hypothetical protein FKW44_022632, partial [Caligus rogercresseyi]